MGEEREYNFKYVLTDERTRKRIIELAKPSKDFFSYQNLNLAYGVYDESARMFVTMTWYMSQSIMRDGRDADDARYAVILPLHSFTAYYEKKLYKSEFGRLSLPVLEKHHFDAVKAAICCYDDHRNRSAFADGLKALDPEASLYAMKEAELNKLIPTLK